MSPHTFLLGTLVFTLMMYLMNSNIPNWNCSHGKRHTKECTLEAILCSPDVEGYIILYTGGIER